MDLGPFVKCPHPEMVEAVALAGFDFAVIDMEHTPLGPRDLYPLVLAAEARKLPLVIRVPANSAAHIKWCLDLGVKRVQVPNISTAEEAMAAVDAAYFHPKGERGLCRFVRAANFSLKDRDLYIARSNIENRLLLQLEGREAVSNAGAILKAIPVGVSLFVGPYDLSQSLGVPGRIWDDAVIDAIKNIADGCKSNGIGVGTFTDTPEGVEFWRKWGMDFVEYGSDLQLFMQGAQRLLEAARGA